MWLTYKLKFQVGIKGLKKSQHKTAFVLKTILDRHFTVVKGKKVETSHVSKGFNPS